MIKMINMIKMIKMIKIIKMIKMLMMIKVIKKIKMTIPMDPNGSQYNNNKYWFITSDRNYYYT